METREINYEVKCFLESANSYRVYVEIEKLIEEGWEFAGSYYNGVNSRIFLRKPKLL